MLLLLVLWFGTIAKRLHISGVQAQIVGDVSMEDLWKQTILFFLETSGPVFQFFLETSSPVFQFLPGCLARNKTAVLSLTWILMPHSLQCIDGRIGWWAHTKQHSCGSLHRLCLYFKERPTVPWSDDYKLQGALATAKTRSVLMRFPDATKKRLRAFREIKPYLLAFGFIYCLQFSLLRVWLFFRQMHAT